MQSRTDAKAGQFFRGFGFAVGGVTTPGNESAPVATGVDQFVV